MDETHYLDWTKRYSVGIPVLDAQHKKLLRMTNVLYAKSFQDEKTARETFIAVAREAADYVLTHFADEETLLREAGYPDYSRHKAQHAEYTKTLLAWTRAFEEGEKFAPLQFAKFLREWFLSHIAIVDQDYKSYMMEYRSRSGSDARRE